METSVSIEATCPECRGPLSEHQVGSLVELRCLVGHSYSARSLLQAHSETQERALWAAVVALEETARLVDAVGPQFTAAEREALIRQVNKKASQALQIRSILEQLEPFELE